MSFSLQRYSTAQDRHHKPYIGGDGVYYTYDRIKGKYVAVAGAQPLVLTIEKDSNGTYHVLNTSIEIQDIATRFLSSGGAHRVGVYDIDSEQCYIVSAVSFRVGERLLFTEGDPSKTVNAVLNYSTRRDDRYIKSLGLDTMTYINAGVMVIDCKRYIQSDYLGKAIKCMERKEQYRYVDQDVLNQICEGDIGLIELSWNVQWNNLGDPQKLIPSIRDLLAFVQPPRIVHYTIEKPWKVMLNDYGKYYQRYVAQNRVLERFETEQ